RFLLVPVFGGSVYVFSIDAASGALTQVAGSPFSTGGTQVRRLVMDPSGRFAYVANQGTATVTAFRFDGTSGALTMIGTPVATGGTSPFSPAMHPSGRNLYVVNRLGTFGVSQYSIDQTSGALTSLGIAATGMSPNDIKLDPSGRYAYVSNGGSN